MKKRNEISYLSILYPSDLKKQVGNLLNKYEAGRKKKRKVVQNIQM